MNPAPSVIIFTVLSGMGFGYMALLATVHDYAGLAALAHWALAYALAVAGLMASAFHLGNPQRALRAFTQWRSSWLSREAWGAALTLIILAPVALSDWLGLGLPEPLGWLGAGLALLTVLATAMIYAQIRAVPRWHHWTVPVLFLAYAVAGGMIIGTMRPYVTWALCLLGVAMALHWHFGARAFAKAGQRMEEATGLGQIGRVSVFEHPHTGGNYLLREMIFVVGRKHAERVRMIAMVCSVLLPVLFLVFVPGFGALVLAVMFHLIGAFAQRWLFFAEAEHVVGLYYGMR